MLQHYHDDLDVTVTVNTIRSLQNYIENQDFFPTHHHTNYNSNTTTTPPT